MHNSNIFSEEIKSKTNVILDSMMTDLYIIKEQDKKL